MKHILRLIHWYLNRLEAGERQSFALSLLSTTEAEAMGTLLVRASGAKVCILSSRVTPYIDEITRLCDHESGFTYSTDDVLGSGYFRARRVMTKMKTRHPELRVRDLWKAVDYCSALCSTSQATGQKQLPEPHLQSR